MFTITSKVVYGLAAMFEMAMAYGSRYVQAAEIARSQGIPEDYLRQLMVSLRKSGLVESARGAEGGYALSRPPSDITVEDVLISIEGRPNLIRIKPRDRILFSFLKECQLKMKDVFNVPLDELVSRKIKQQQNFTYAI